MMKKEKTIIAKIPSTDAEAIKSNLLSLFQKKNLIGFYKYLDKFEEDKPDTWGKYKLDQITMMELYKAYGLGESA